MLSQMSFMDATFLLANTLSLKWEVDICKVKTKLFAVSLKRLKASQRFESTFRILTRGIHKDNSKGYIKHEHILYLS